MVNGDVIFGTVDQGSVKDGLVQIHYENGDIYIGHIEKQ